MNDRAHGMRELSESGVADDGGRMLRRLSLLFGLENGYWDIAGRWNELGEQSARAILQAFGCMIAGDAEISAAVDALERARAEEIIPPVIVVHREELPLSVPLTVSLTGPPGAEKSQISWEFFEEGGRRCTGRRVFGELARVDGNALLNLPIFPKDGYHYVRVSFESPGGTAPEVSAGCRVIVCPNRCYLPLELQSGERWWGVGVQLPALRSARNWGVGDFSDLREIGRAVLRAGGKFVGVNPLHALPPGGASPYSPSSRLEIQMLAIDLEAVPEFRISAGVKSFLRLKKTQKELEFLRSAELIDYARCSTLKTQCLRLMFEEFSEQHLATESERAHAFFDFIESRGERLRRYAIHSALAEKFSRESGAWAWFHWPEEYRDPHSPAVEKFAAKESREIRFYQYQAWLADSQLEELREEFRSIGLSLGCYGDLALGADPAGAENWIDQDVFVQGVSLGAPPDALGPLGQVWGLPAVSPRKLREEGYEPFAALLRYQMKRAGAIRLDHVMQLFRLFLVPCGMQAKDGAYLRYPLHDLAGIVALESQRNGTVVIGEDLGTVPPEISRCMVERGLLSYRVLYFSQDGKGFLPPEAYPPSALVVTSTHDLPTLKGYLGKCDIRLREELGLVPAEETMKELDRRSREIQELLTAVGAPGETDFAVINEAVHRYLARSPCLLQLIQLEDLLGQAEQCNVPGTVNEHPNWRRRYQADLEAILELLKNSPVLKAVAEERKS